AASVRLLASSVRLSARSVRASACSISARWLAAPASWFPFLIAPPSPSAGRLGMLAEHAGKTGLLFIALRLLSGISRAFHGDTHEFFMDTYCRPPRLPSIRCNP